MGRTYIGDRRGRRWWCSSWDRRHDERLLLDHALPSLPITRRKPPRGLFLLLLELGLELLAALLRYVLILDLNSR